jgi:hypothetical protein
MNPPFPLVQKVLLRITKKTLETLGQKKTYAGQCTIGDDTNVVIITLVYMFDFVEWSCFFKHSSKYLA